MKKLYPVEFNILYRLNIVHVISMKIIFMQTFPLFFLNGPFDVFLVLGFYLADAICYTKTCTNKIVKVEVGVFLFSYPRCVLLLLLFFILTW